MSLSAGFTFLLALGLAASPLAEPMPAAPTRWRVMHKDSPGVALWLVETGRRSLRDGTPEVTYSVHASGFPQGITYSLWMNRVEEEPIKIVNKMFVDETGEMTVREFREDTEVPFLPAPLKQVLPITLDHFQPAEPIFLKAEASDRSVAGHAIEFPIPIEDRDGSCHLFLEMIDRGRTAFAAWGQGFEPNETVITESRSGKELVRSSLVTGDTGGFMLLLMPEIQGRQRGKASFTVTAASCSVHVEYAWGKRKN